MAATFEANGIKLQQASGDDDPSDVLLTGFVFPDQPQHTIPALVLKSTKDRIQQLSATVSAPLHDLENPFKITTSDTAGQGLLATVDIQPGRLILSERPLFVTRSELPASSSQIETYLQVLFARLPQVQQAIFSKLENCKFPLECGPLLGRLRTNGFTFNPYPGAPPHAGVFATLSRCNHSCGPNAFAHFNHQTWAIELRASRAIKAGEEIVISYVDVLDPCLKRRAQLAANYEFTCKCKWCTFPKSKKVESDARRTEIASWPETKLVQVLQSGSTSVQSLFGETSSQAGAVNPSALIMPTISKIVTISREGLEPFSLPHTLALSKVYAQLGDEKNYQKWRMSSRDLSLALCGESEETATASQQLDDPVNTVSGWGSYVEAQGISGA
ncbi:hypothetical protein PIIN_05034 [Serendipita indica DSM 11827]|uniref:SET domain-containing protein n=1 Tax=Serendipita indica (strain DSM 11827) TaxID=1109443 RepID=G4TIF6_SERID|nr:hypothetical protein PIIN_05034 [Serendipita indica DSM 11827]